MFVSFSHGHTDHVGGIISHASKRGLYGMPPATYYLPPHLEKPLSDAIKAFSTMNGERIDLKLQSVKIDERIQVVINVVLYLYQLCCYWIIQQLVFF